MLQFISLLLVFIYFKIARVYQKEESINALVIIQHLMVFIASLFLFYSAFMMYSWYIVIILSLLFFIVAGLLITAIQLGIFVDGKPLFGLSKLYRYLPILTGSIVLLSLVLVYV